MRDDALLGDGQCLDQLHLLLNFLLRPALLRRGGCCVCFVVDERIERGVECLRDDRQQRHWHAASSLPERVHRLLGNPPTLPPVALG